MIKKVAWLTKIIPGQSRSPTNKNVSDDLCSLQTEYLWQFLEEDILHPRVHV